MHGRRRRRSPLAPHGRVTRIVLGGRSMVEVVLPVPVAHTGRHEDVVVVAAHPRSRTVGGGNNSMERPAPPRRWRTGGVYAEGEEGLTTQQQRDDGRGGSWLRGLLWPHVDVCRSIELHTRTIALPSTRVACATVYGSLETAQVVPGSRPATLHASSLLAGPTTREPLLDAADDFALITPRLFQRRLQ